jgi:UDP-N-acetylglucosamine--N-acetylmuramyl-(pentapeptide) pyrophosphoryl-undecaprenol N-acetylglucosamine transferase
MAGAAQVLATAGIQVLHLTGARDFENIQAVYAGRACRVVVRPFLAEMDLALSAATVAVSRAGASSLAELAAMQVPAILIPYPAAADNHQYFNARAFVDTGAAEMLEQPALNSERLAAELLELIRDHARRCRMQQNLAWWHKPKAAADIAQRIVDAVEQRGSGAGESGSNADRPKACSR